MQKWTPLTSKLGCLCARAQTRGSGVLGADWSGCFSNWNCIIKTGTGARETAPPHLIKCGCHARRRAAHRRLYGTPNTLFTHLVLSFSLLNQVHGYLFRWYYSLFGFLLFRFCPSYLLTGTSTSYFQIPLLPPPLQISPTRSWSGTLKGYNQWKSTTLGAHLIHTIGQSWSKGVDWVKPHFISTPISHPACALYNPLFWSTEVAFPPPLPSQSQSKPFPFIWTSVLPFPPFSYFSPLRTLTCPSPFHLHLHIPMLCCTSFQPIHFFSFYYKSLPKSYLNLHQQLSLKLHYLQLLQH